LLEKDLLSLKIPLNKIYLIDSRFNIEGINHTLLYEYSIISTFSCTFEAFKNDVTNLFIEDMCKDFITDYEFVKVNDHKSHLLMHCTDLEKLGVVMTDPFVTE